MINKVASSMLINKVLSCMLIKLMMMSNSMLIMLMVSCLPAQTHRPGGQHPLQGVLPLCTVGRDQFPLSHKQTPGSTCNIVHAYD